MTEHREISGQSAHSASQTAGPTRSPAEQAALDQRRDQVRLMIGGVEKVLKPPSPDEFREQLARLAGQEQ